MSGSGYIYNYPGNIVDITGSTLTILLDLLDKDTYAEHTLPLPTGVLPADTRTQLAQPLSALFDQVWSGKTDSSGKTMQQNATATVFTQITGSGGSNASGSIPSTGRLRALVLDNGALILSYWLGGASFKFDKGPLGATWNLTFDAELMVTIDLQNWPNLTPKAAPGVFNANISSANVGASLDEAAQQIANFFTGQPSAIFQVQEGSVDSTKPSVDLGAVTALLQQLVSSGLANGFAWKCTASVDPAAAALTLTMFHVRDPVTNVIDTQSGRSLFHAVLATGASEVSPGQQVSVKGSYFPPDQADQIRIGWTDSSSPAISSSEIQWGEASATTLTDATKSRKRYDGGNFFEATGLKPSTAYKFRVRDCELLTCSPWSNFLQVTTGATNQVSLYLGTGAQSRLVGLAMLDNGGGFSFSIVIPPATAPGPTTLWAKLGGAQVASTPLTIVAKGQTAQATLSVLDAATGTVLNGPPVVATEAFEVRGEGFRAGQVTIAVDTGANPSTSPGTKIGTTTADGNGQFTAKLTWPRGILGNHQVVAYQQLGQGASLQTVRASAAVYGEALPS